MAFGIPLHKALGKCVSELTISNMATVSAMLVLSRLRHGEQGEFESLIRKRQIPEEKRKKLMMLMIALAIVVNPPRDRTLWVGPRTDAWIAMACNEFSEKQWH